MQAMKHFSNTASSLLGLLMLTGLALTLALLFSGQQQETQTGAKVFQSPIEPAGALNLACSLALRPGAQPAPAIIRGVPTPDIPKPAPAATAPVQLEPGSRVSPPSLLITSNPQAAIGLRVAVHGDQIVIPVTDAEGWTCIFVSDLASGRSEQIATLKGGLGDLAISDRYLVWTDEIIAEGSNCPPILTLETSTPSPSPLCAYIPPQQRTEMHIYDLGAGREIAHQVVKRHFFDLASDVLVWQEYGDTRGIYGRNLATGQPFTATTRIATYPHVAGDWVAYVDAKESTNEWWVTNLYLFNRKTGEESFIGPVSHDPDGGGYAIDGESLAWVKVLSGSSQQGATPPAYELHVYTLATGRDRKLDIVEDVYPTDLHLSDSLLLYHTQDGWQAMDLRRDLKFTIFPFSSALESVAGLKLSSERLVWLVSDRASGINQLYTAHVNRGR